MSAYRTAAEMPKAEARLKRIRTEKRSRLSIKYRKPVAVLFAALVLSEMLGAIGGLDGVFLVALAWAGCGCIALILWGVVLFLTAWEER